MSALSRPKPRSPERPAQPADLVRQWGPLIREIESDAEIDFSFSKDAITICDMRAPAALRYGVLFKRAELTPRPSDDEVRRRVREFMR